MSSIRQVAEQAYLMVNGKVTADAANGLVEYELAAQQVFASVCKLSYFESNRDGERIVDNSWLRPVDCVAERDEDTQLFFICLPFAPMDLQRDIGIYWVGTKLNVSGNYVKVSRGLASQINGAGIKKRYMREGLKIYFLDGLLGEQKDIRVLMAVAGSVDCDDEGTVPDDLAPIVIEQVKRQFIPYKAVREDKLNDGKDNSKA